MGGNIIIIYSYNGFSADQIFVTKGDEFVPYNSSDNYARGLLNFFKHVSIEEGKIKLLEEILSKMTCIESMIDTVKIFAEDKDLVIEAIYTGCDQCWRLTTDVDDCSAV